MVMLGISSENATEFAMVDDDFEFSSFSLFSSIAFTLLQVLYINKNLCTYSSFPPLSLSFFHKTISQKQCSPLIIFCFFSLLYGITVHCSITFQSILLPQLIQLHYLIQKYSFLKAKTIVQTIYFKLLTRSLVSFLICIYACTEVKRVKLLNKLKHHKIINVQFYNKKNNK